MLVAITGASGFVGRHIIQRLLDRGHTVRALVRRPAALPSTVEAVSGHLADTKTLATLVAGADVVIHLVGIIVERGSETFEEVHVQGTRRVLAAAREAGCRRFVHMSAVGARDEKGATAYHRTKARGEQAVRESGLAAAVFRPSFIIGPGNLPVATIAQLHRLLPMVPVFGDGRFPMQPVWVIDVAHAFALAVERPDTTGTFELGGPDVMTYLEFVRAIGRAMGRERRVVHIPLPLVRLAAWAGTLLGPAAPLTRGQLQMLVEGTVTPQNAIERVFGIRPARLDEALRFLKNQTRG